MTEEEILRAFLDLDHEVIQESLLFKRVDGK